MPADPTGSRGACRTRSFSCDAESEALVEVHGWICFHDPEHQRSIGSHRLPHQGVDRRSAKTLTSQGAAYEELARNSASSFTKLWNQPISVPLSVMLIT